MGFDKETLLYTNKEYSHWNVQLYRTEQAILDEKEHSQLHYKLGSYFRESIWYNKTTLSQLREVTKILGI